MNTKYSIRIHTALCGVIMSLIILFTPATVSAQANFSLSFDEQYIFDEHGNATVIKKITLTNQNTDTYPSVYLVDVPEDASDIAVADKNGPLDYTLESEGGRKIVRIALPEQVVGFNQSSNFHISYDTRVLTKRQGSIWQISIPPLSSDERIASYTTKVQTPPEWGSVSYSSPDSEKPFSWTMAERGEDSILIIFGEFQTVTGTPTSGTSITIRQLLIAIGIGLASATTLFIVYRTRLHRHGS